MRSILVFADKTAGMAARLDAALSLARANDGHLTALVDTPVTRYVAIDPLGGGVVASAALNDALDEDDKHAADLEQQLASCGVPYQVVRSEDEPVAALAAAARLADVVVVSRRPSLAGALAMVARTPVLVMPEGGNLSFPLRSVSVAWDGGNEAAVALRGAVSLLRQAKEVHVITIAEKPGGLSAADAVNYLRQHGVSAILHEVERQGTTEETLAAEVARLNSEVLVMGAYGKSRMREYLFGGVTQHFLEHSGAPGLLVMH